MALLTPEDIQAALNIDLSTPNGQTLATSLIAAATAYIEQAVGYPLEEAEVTTYFDGEDYRLWLPTSAPVSNVSVATYNRLTHVYDELSAQYNRHSGNQVLLALGLSDGFQDRAGDLHYRLECRYAPRRIGTGPNGLSRMTCRVRFVRSLCGAQGQTGFTGDAEGIDGTLTQIDNCGASERMRSIEHCVIAYWRMRTISALGMTEQV